MPNLMSCGLQQALFRPIRRVASGALLSVSMLGVSAPSWANTEDTTQAPYRSAMDAPLFFQLLLGEIELQAGRTPQAFDVLLDAARRTRDESLFKRAVQVALQTRSSDRVQATLRAWRQALPQSQDALRYQLQFALSSQRPADAVEPFAMLVDRAAPAERPNIISALPQIIERATDAKPVAAAFEPTLLGLSQQPGLRAPALAALGRLQGAAGDAGKALTLAQQAHTADPDSREAAALAVDLMARMPAAEAIVLAYLARSRPGGKPDTAMRLAYGQTLAQGNRHGDALPVLEKTLQERPDLASGWLTLGAVHLELKHPSDAEVALKRYLAVQEQAALVDDAPSPTPAGAAPQADTDDAENRAMQRMIRAANASAGRNQAYLMLSQVAEQRGDAPTASMWLEKIEGGQRGLDVTLRRASLMAKSGQVAQARALIQAHPEQGPEDARAKLIAESQMLRDIKRWQDAYDVLASGTQRFAKDVDLLYEQAMMAEKLNRMDVMERLLREVISLKADHHHAYNALGYSLADRGVRLPEARVLVQKALDLAPGDPFITDSLGWIEFRLGNRAEALRLLKQAWATRPDTEIGAHLGEVLWSAGERDEARRIWREARTRDAANDVLKETLARLKVDL
jgi:tetratricopeptide (TPR) repeat protein